jgi:hypothetical protein
VIVDLREVRPGDAEAVFATLRAREAYISLEQVHEALEDSLFTLVWTVDGRPGAMCGTRLASMLDNRVYAWMLGTTLIDRHPVAFLRHSRRAIRFFAERYGQVYGQVECDFGRSTRWLHWLGCDFVADTGQVKVWSWTP